MSTPPAYQVRESTADAEGELMLSLWRQGLEHQGVPQGKLDWFYRSHPLSPPRVFFLSAGDRAEACGTATLAERAMKHNGQLFRAGMLADFVLHADQRTLFPALALQRAMREYALRAHEVVFGFPNPKSMAVVKRAGYRQVTDLVRRVRVVRSAIYLSRILPGPLARLVALFADPLRMVRMYAVRLIDRRWTVSWQSEPDARFDDLWARCRGQATYIGVRNRAFLDWRFVRSPLVTSRFLTVSDAAGALVGYAVLEQEEGGTAIIDLLVDADNDSALRRLLAETVLDAYHHKEQSVMLTFGGSSAMHDKFARMGFVRRDQQPVIAAGREAGGDWAVGDNWYLTGADQDS